MSSDQHAEYVAVRDDLPENFWLVHGWDRDGHRPVSVDVADRKRIIEGVLAAINAWIDDE
jgi:hypothetical protein